MRPAKTKQESAQRSAPKERQRNLGTPERARLIPASQGRNPAFTSCFRMSALILFGFVEKPSATGAQPSWLWGKRASSPLSRGKRQARCLSAPQVEACAPACSPAFQQSHIVFDRAAFPPKFSGPYWIILKNSG